MATSALPNSESRSGLAGAGTLGANPVLRVALATLHAVASLKLTVTLLALSIALVFIGTLAQVEQDMWDVLADYFDAWACMVPISVLFPRSWFPDLELPNIKFPFVGGKLIGLSMIFNLFAAHLIRFKLQARGMQLIWGLVVLAFGVLVTTIVIVAGQGQGGLQGKAPISWVALWTVLKTVLAMGFAAGLAACFTVKLETLPARVLLIGSTTLAGIASAILWMPGNNLYLGDAGMRILWQLIEAEFAALGLLAGAWILFRKRAGIVVIHTGVGLLMLGQLLVSLFAVEERMTIQEGETINYVHDIRAVELAITDTSDPKQDYVVVVPLIEKGKPTEYVPSETNDESQAPAKPGRPVDLKDPRWPFNLEVVQFFKNSSVDDRPADDPPGLATAGFGREIKVLPARKAAGTDSDGAVDRAAAWVRFTSKDGQDLGTYMVSQMFLRVERLVVDNRAFEIALRFKRAYKPYAFTLKDVSKTDYPGTSVPKDYRSELTLVDATHDFSSDVKISMNEPLRYSGETFYQSKWDPGRGGVEVTELQVVTNMGWMIPYVACMIVGTGMFAHFGIVLARFLDRLGQSSTDPAEETTAKADRSADDPQRRKGKGRGKSAAEDAAAGGIAGRVSWSRFLVPAATCVLFLLSILYLVRVPSTPNGKFDYYAFGQIPVLDKGRVKPLDTFARNTLRVMSNRETFKNPSFEKRRQTRPAIEWLAEVIADTPESSTFQVFRIENLDVLHLLKLERRKGLLYSIDDLKDNIEVLQDGVDAAARKPKEDRTTYERKLLELASRLKTYMVLRSSFKPLPLPPFPTEEDLKQDREEAIRRAMRIRQFLAEIPEFERQLALEQPPRVIPLAVSRRGTPNAASGEDSETWIPYSTASHRGYEDRLRNPDDPPNEANLLFTSIVSAMSQRDAGAFNGAVSQYKQLVDNMRPDLYSAKRTTFESWFNNFSPFYYMMIFYVLAFVLTGLGWLTAPFGWARSLHRTGYWLVVCTFAVHSFALIARIIISGRPPVTNLYSSAIFIGWACVVAGVVLEPLIRHGVGNTVASFAGFVTLLIAHYLSLDGDTVAVMVAVLDTQFWLSTHVVCITLGYAATMVAGLLGVIYIVASHKKSAIDTPVLRRGATVTSMGKLLATAIYGTLCFAMLFSFVGTVLGGLWADDSWGRFWGWDPKENGALIIVLWNALILHTRWDGMVKERGLAVLAIGGNIVTCWSWFGVNELGVGLHSYGFTEGVLMYLTITVVVHLGLMASAIVPWLRDRSMASRSVGA